jgi:cyclomaltodextrinase / maltogenic alpha-amylase / neopullulanase
MNAHHRPFAGPVYHIFPLGALGAEPRAADSPFTQDAPVPPDSGRNIRALAAWIPHLTGLGVEAVLLGPVFASESHGYDVSDLSRIDPRLGTNGDFAALCEEFHAAGISVLLDAVFNHVGRSFFAFADVEANRERSPYRDWFSGLRFDRPGPAGDGVDYDTWDGHGSLVKLNVTHPSVRDYLLGAVDAWMTEFGIDGLRLDAADVIAPPFWRELRARVDGRYRTERAFGRGRFWLNGEMVHGDYAAICGPDRLDGTTNYEVYKGLYSSCNDGNFHEIAHSLGRQFGPGGLYRGLPLLTFLDNHDVPRIATILRDRRHLVPLHMLLFTVPGTPAIYYGSEAGIEGTKGRDDRDLRPPLTPEDLPGMLAGDAPEEVTVLPDLIRRLAELRHRHADLAGEEFALLAVTSLQILFARGALLVAVNGAPEEARIELPRDARGATDGQWVDLLSGEELTVDGAPPAISVPPMGGRILARR